MFVTTLLLGLFNNVEANNYLFMVLDIFQEAGLPLWLRPYEVLVTSSYTALIETIPDTVIMHFCYLKDAIRSFSFALLSCCTIFRLHFILSKVDIPTSLAYEISSLPSTKKILLVLSLPR